MGASCRHSGPPPFGRRALAVLQAPARESSRPAGLDTARSRSSLAGPGPKAHKAARRGQATNATPETSVHTRNGAPTLPAWHRPQYHYGPRSTGPSGRLPSVRIQQSMVQCTRNRPTRFFGRSNQAPHPGMNLTRQIGSSGRARNTIKRAMGRQSIARWGANQARAGTPSASNVARATPPRDGRRTRALVCTSCRMSMLRGNSEDALRSSVRRLATLGGVPVAATGDCNRRATTTPRRQSVVANPLKPTTPRRHCCATRLTPVAPSAAQTQSKPRTTTSPCARGNRYRHERAWRRNCVQLVERQGKNFGHHATTPRLQATMLGVFSMPLAGGRRAGGKPHCLHLQHIPGGQLHRWLRHRRPARLLPPPAQIPCANLLRRLATGRRTLRNAFFVWCKFLQERQILLRCGP